MKPFTDAQRIEFLAYWLDRRQAWLRISTKGRITATVNPYYTQGECDPDGECVLDAFPEHPTADFRTRLDEAIAEAIRYGYFRFSTYDHHP